MVISDQTDSKSLSAHMAGHDLLVSTIGAFPKPEDTESHLMFNIAKAYIPSMLECGVKRLFTIFGAGLLGETVPETFKDAADGGAPHPIPLIQRDCKKAFDIIDAYKLDYTIWCPANFPGGDYSDKYITKKNEIPGASEVTTGMVAHSMAREIEERQFIKARVGISRTDVSQ